MPDSERSLTLEVPAPKGSKATFVQKKKWAERTIVAMSKYDGFDMIRQEMAAQELAEMAATGDEGRTAVYEAGAIAPLVICWDAVPRSPSGGRRRRCGASLSSTITTASSV